jgi:hypothetical protein
MFDRFTVELVKMHGLPCSCAMQVTMEQSPIRADNAPEVRWPASAI